jgi:hypothetical protein
MFWRSSAPLISSAPTSRHRCAASYSPCTIGILIRLSLLPFATVSTVCSVKVRRAGSGAPRSKYTRTSSPAVATPIVRDSGGSLIVSPCTIVSVGGSTTTAPPLAFLASTRNTLGRRASSDTATTKAPSSSSAIHGLSHRPSARVSRTSAATALPEAARSTRRPTTCGVRSDDIAGYCSHSLQPRSGSSAVGRASSPAVAA